MIASQVANSYSLVSELRITSASGHWAIGTVDSEHGAMTGHLCLPSRLQRGTGVCVSQVRCNCAGVVIGRQ